MVKAPLLAAMLLFSSCTTGVLTRRAADETKPAYATRFYGSAGAEKQLTPANSASPLNPRNVAQIPYATNVADATLFAEVMPESRRWKGRLKVRADGNDQRDDEVEIGEGYLQWKANDWLDVTAGRVIEKWGTGYAWNPTAFVGPRKNPTDPGDRRGAYRGTDMIKADLFVRDTSVSLYALDGGAFAARAYRLIHGTDVALHLYRDENGTQQGMSVARVFGDALELHAEASRRRLLIGGQYTFPGGANLIAELHRSGAGLSSTEWREFQDDAATARDELSLRRLNAAYRPLQMGREYAFLRLALPAFHEFETELIAIPSLRDGSSVVRLGVTRKIRQNLSAYLIDTEFVGSGHSELSYMQIERSTVFGMRYYF
jgi:hypothetical protein